MVDIIVDKGSKGGDGLPGSPPVTEITIKVGEEMKTFSAKDVAALVGQEATMTENLQKVAPLIKAAEKYGVDPEAYVVQAEGAFSRFGELMDEGVLDDAGTLIKKGPEKVAPVSDSIPIVPVVPVVAGTPTPVSTKFEDTVMVALTDIGKRQGKLEESQGEIMKMNIDQELRKQNPELDNEDVLRLFARAKVRPEKTIWDHAKDAVAGKKVQREVIRKDLAKEMGIANLEEFDKLNKLKEQEAEGGASAVVKGKRLSFFGGKDSITPGEAMRKMFRGQGLEK